ncbi:MAG: hypothetical protein FWG32_04445 [Oscillospiraceae bacterium]|nr:hypothetical protein [Oscillospiraceae bacterium]
MRDNIENALRNVKKVDVPDSTFAKVDDVLRNLEHRKGEIHMKPGYRKMAVIAAAVAAMLLITTTALAITNSFGIPDFFNSRINSGDVLPDASNIVQSDVPQNAGQSDLATFEVREAVFDGSDIYIVFTVTPTQKNTILLIAQDLYPDDRITALGPLFNGKTETIAEYAAANGLKIVRAGIGRLAGGLSCQTERDGTLVLILHSHYNGDAVDELDLNLSCVLTPMPYSAETEHDYPATNLSFTLINTGHFETASIKQPVEFADVGIRIDCITLSASEVSVNVRVEYTVIDRARYEATEDSLLFEFLRDDHESLPFGPEQRLPDGPGGIGGIISLDDTNTRLETEWSLAAMDTLPDHLIVRGFNCIDKTRYETHVIEVSK